MSRVRSELDTFSGEIREKGKKSDAYLELAQKMKGKYTKISDTDSICFFGALHKKTR
jgi:hypothetical protein